jgi:hypothetical protein
LILHPATPLDPRHLSAAMTERMYRPAVIAVIAFLILGVVFFLVWPGVRRLFSPVPPGQYPLDADRPEWTVAERVRPFQPSATMGSDVAVSANVTGPKVVSATQRTM